MSYAEIRKSFRERRQTTALVNTVDEACYRLKCCRATFYKQVKAGKIKLTKYGTRSGVTETELQRVAQEGW